MPLSVGSDAKRCPAFERVDFVTGNCMSRLLFASFVHARFSSNDERMHFTDGRASLYRLDSRRHSAPGPVPLSATETRSWRTTSRSSPLRLHCGGTENSVDTESGNFRHAREYGVPDTEDKGPVSRSACADSASMHRAAASRETRNRTAATLRSPRAPGACHVNTMHSSQVGTMRG